MPVLAPVITATLPASTALDTHFPLQNMPIVPRLILFKWIIPKPGDAMQCFIVIYFCLVIFKDTSLLSRRRSMVINLILQKPK